MVARLVAAPCYEYLLHGVDMRGGGTAVVVLRVGGTADLRVHILGPYPRSTI